MKWRSLTILFFSFFVILFTQCKIDPEIISGEEWVYDPTPYAVMAPMGIPNVPTTNGNPLTAKGVELGRYLFYDPILSADSTLSCAGCHNVNHAFSDTVKFSIGIDGIAGKRNAMPIFNLGFQPYDNGFFWDGRATTLEDQVLMPIQDPVEMHEILPNVITKLSRSDIYPKMFYEAFGESTITADLTGKALAQFVKSLLAGNAKFDSVVAGFAFFTDDELAGYLSFEALDGGDCFHCHGVNGGLFSDYIYRNNGIDLAHRYFDFADAGYGLITGDTSDYGKFKTPSLRNIELTAPYMHDGRFATLEEVLDYYSEGVNDTPFTDNFMQFAFQGGVQLDATEKAQLIAFLKTLTDHTLKDNPIYQNPFEED